MSLHVCHFNRITNCQTILLKNVIDSSPHFSGTHGDFDRLRKIFIGGVYRGGEVVRGTEYQGIIGGKRLFFYCMCMHHYRSGHEL